ncbi:IclR family transcriptional regulator [Halegenticoccus tardaugens]|uniref:IclR family transcriptional regulator n=1 Tax=Halegenticoccus tardaugens TaxID=2071624 RepID=UPI00100B6A04|nr:IclR family transcriptional regulator [Halegenticoccus tardaugens]
MKKESDIIQASLTTFRVAEALKHLEGAGVTELAAHLGLPKSTVHYHLQTLMEAEFIVADDDEYRIGLRFLDFGEFVRDRVELLGAAEPALRKLAEETGEIASLMVEEHGRGVYVAREKSEGAVQTSFHTGKRVPLHQTSAGKAILAFTPRERVEEIIDRHGLPGKTPNTISDGDRLFETLDEIRERGYAYDDEEWHRGLRCIAAPIRDMDDQAIGAVSVAAPLSRTRGDRYRRDLPDAVLSTANVIELNMEYS